MGSTWPAAIHERKPPPDWAPIVIAEGGVLVRIAALLMTKAEAEFFEQALYDMHQDTCIPQLLKPRFRTQEFVDAEMAK